MLENVMRLLPKHPVLSQITPKWGDTQTCRIIGCQGMEKRIKLLLSVGTVVVLGTLGATRYLIWQTRDKTAEIRAAYIRNTPVLSEEALRTYVPQTKQRFMSIQEVPEDVRTVFLDSLNIDKQFDPLKFAAAPWTVKDRAELWFGGCSAGEHFLEAGEMPDGWWILFEQGGFVDATRLVLIARTEGRLKITASHFVKGR